MNLVFKNGEEVTTGSKDSGEAGEVTGVVVNLLNK